MRSGDTSVNVQVPTHGVRDIDQYKKAWAYYSNTKVYEKLNVHMRRSSDGIPYSAMKSLRNPALGAVDFQADHLWGGKPSEVEIDGPKIVVDAVRQVYKWSNMNERGKVAARFFALYGDFFMKVAKPDNREQVVEQFIDPSHVTDFDKDDRGFFTLIRLDIPSEKRDEEGKPKAYLHTEIWKKTRDASGEESGYFRYWERKEGASVEDSEEKMGDPTGGEFLAARKPGEPGVLGFDFIPFVHAKFKDIGEPRGIGVFANHTEDIDETNRLATRLHEMFFRYDRPYKGLKSVGTDAEGRPLAQPKVDVATRSERQQDYADAGYETDTSRPDEVELAGEKMTLLPANVEPVDLTPNVDYDAGAAMLAAQMDWIAEILPETIAYRLQDKGEMSGRALKTILKGAIDRAKEARDNFEAAMVRANEMALTMGKIHGLEGFTELGEYESGALEHSFVERPILADSDDEKIDKESKEADLVLKWIQAGGDRKALLKDAGVKVGESGGAVEEEPDPQTEDALAEAKRELAGMGGETDE